MDAPAVALNIGLEYELITRSLFAMFVVVVIGIPGTSALCLSHELSVFFTVDTFITSPALFLLYKFTRRERPGAQSRKPPIQLCATGEGTVTRLLPLYHILFLTHAILSQSHLYQRRSAQPYPLRRRFPAKRRYKSSASPRNWTGLPCT